MKWLSCARERISIDIVDHIDRVWPVEEIAGLAIGFPGLEAQAIQEAPFAFACLKNTVQGNELQRHQLTQVAISELCAAIQLLLMYQILLAGILFRESCSHLD